MGRYTGSGGTRIFFRLSLGHESVTNYYTTNFNLMQHHKYSLAEVENLIPWEREIYLMLLMKYIEEENERKKQEQQR
jgi:hypothetical protein